MQAFGLTIDVKRNY